MAGFGIDQALVNASTPVATELSPLESSATRIVPTYEPATRWIRITAVDDQGVPTSLLCTGRTDLVAADHAGVVQQADLDRLATQLRCEPAPAVAATT